MNPIIAKMKAAQESGRVFPEEINPVWLKLIEDPDFKSTLDKLIIECISEPRALGQAVKIMFGLGYLAATEPAEEEPRPDPKTCVEELAKDLAIHFTDKEMK